ncbi:M28 family peptidase [Lewinella sp. LCG006]|uniref:M28 family peptidase n=1 Tax=Lewinella sp. LCG006 TaxID=3231911 RepID=UPI0034602C5E
MRNSKLFLFGLIFLVLGSLIYSSCKPDVPTTGNPPPRPKGPVQVPTFDADAAYNDIAKQVSFGPRVMGSEGHEATKNWLVAELKATGAKVIEQNFQATVYTGEKYPATNIIAQFNPEVSDRIMLAAHWDTRHIADSPLSTEREGEPILGADDGGSGVGVLLQIARTLAAQKVGIGVDLVLFDAEDYGEAGGEPTTYCLGSQYWSTNRPTPIKPRYGILLDMVGAKDAEFKIEGNSWQYAQPIVEKVWILAKQMGRSNYFLNEGGPGITDDHFFVNTIAGIPMIDIINLKGTEETAFGPHWHTHNDDVAIIDKNTLRAVGQVLLAVIYREDAGQL